MMDYTELIRSLRNCSNNRCTPCDCGWFNKYQVDESCKEIIMWKAAAAIEALQAENPIVESVLVDKMRQQMEETVCHCNVKENAELIARILDDDVDGKVFEMPKRGEIVRCGECAHCYAEGFVHERNICEKHPELGNVPDDWFCADGEREVLE